MCPALCSLNINEGWSAVKQHGKYKKHKEHLERSQTNPEFRQVDNSSPSIIQSIAKMVEQKEVAEKMTDKRLRGQIIMWLPPCTTGAAGSSSSVRRRYSPRYFPLLSTASRQRPGI